MVVIMRAAKVLIVLYKGMEAYKWSLIFKCTDNTWGQDKSIVTIINTTEYSFTFILYVDSF